MTRSKVGAVDLHHGRPVHIVEWVRDDQSDIQIRGVEASRGSAPQRSALSSWRQSKGSALSRMTISCSLERSGVAMDISMQELEERISAIRVIP